MVNEEHYGDTRLSPLIWVECTFKQEVNNYTNLLRLTPACRSPSGVRREKGQEIRLIGIRQQARRDALQQDYSAGCKETIFTKDQFRKLEPFIRGWKGAPFMAIVWMYFPYLTMEVKCGNEGLNISGRSVL